MFIIEFILENGLLDTLAATEGLKAKHPEISAIALADLDEGTCVRVYSDIELPEEAHDKIKADIMAFVV